MTNKQIKIIVDNIARSKQRELYMLGFNMSKKIEKKIKGIVVGEEIKKESKSDEIVNIFEGIITPVMNGFIDGIKDKLFIGAGMISIIGASIFGLGYIFGRKK